MKPEIHIPPEVIEAMTAARRKYLATIEADTRIGELTDGEHADISADEIRAALAEWVTCGMASESTASFSPKYGWMPDGCSNTAVLIIRTEAP